MQGIGGACEEPFSGESFDEIVQKAIPHMMADEEHKASIAALEAETGENEEQWMARMRKEFDERPGDQ